MAIPQTGLQQNCVRETDENFTEDRHMILKIALLKLLPGNTPEEEGVYLSEIDLDQLRAYRADEVMGNAWRHPEKYGALVSGTFIPVGQE